jgi:hypothetical protein
VQVKLISVSHSAAAAAAAATTVAVTVIRHIGHTVRNMFSSLLPFIERVADMSAISSPSHM